MKNDPESLPPSGAASDSGMSTEQAILIAAEAEFMQKGFAAARTTSIARAAGVTHSMLHYYFRSKETLFERIVQAKAAEMGAVILTALSDSTKSFTEKVVDVLVCHFEFVKRNPLLPSFLLAEANSDSTIMDLFKENVRKTAMPLFASTFGQLQEEIASHKVCDIDITTLLTDILSLNVVSVAMASPLSSMLGMDKEEFLEMRLRENIETIKRRLKP